MAVGVRQALLRPELPAGYVRRRLVLVPGERLACRPSSWSGTLLLVVSGQLEVVCPSASGRFGPDSLLPPAWLGAVELWNPGNRPLVMLAIWRSGTRRATALGSER